MEASREESKSEKQKKIQFQLGQVFESFSQLMKFKLRYEYERSVKLSIGHSKSVTRTKVKNVAENLKNYEVQLVCYRSGVYKTKSTGKRRCTSKKTNCPFHVRLSATNKNALIVKKIHLTHNHSSPENSDNSSSEDNSNDTEIAKNLLNVHSNTQRDPGKTGDLNTENQSLDEGEVILDMTVNEISETSLEKIAEGHCHVNVSMNTLGEAFHDIINAEFILEADLSHENGRPRRPSPESGSSVDVLNKTAQKLTEAVTAGNDRENLAKQSRNFPSEDVVNSTVAHGSPEHLMQKATRSVSTTVLESVKHDSKLNPSGQGTLDVTAEKSLIDMGERELPKGNSSIKSSTPISNPSESAENSVLEKTLNLSRQNMKKRPRSVSPKSGSFRDAVNQNSQKLTEAVTTENGSENLAKRPRNFPPEDVVNSTVVQGSPEHLIQNATPDASSTILEPVKRDSTLNPPIQKALDSVSEESPMDLSKKAFCHVNVPIKAAKPPSNAPLSTADLSEPAENSVFQKLLNQSHRNTNQIPQSISPKPNSFKDAVKKTAEKRPETVTAGNFKENSAINSRNFPPEDEETSAVVHGSSEHLIRHSTPDGSTTPLEAVKRDPTVHIPLNPLPQDSPSKPVESSLFEHSAAVLGHQGRNRLDVLRKIGPVQKVGNRRGAPRGRRTTVIGAPIKKATNAKPTLESSRKGKITFASRDNDKKRKILLVWLLGDTYQKDRNYEASKVQMSEINYQQLKDGFIDTPSDDLALLLTCMQYDAYEHLVKSVDEKIQADDFKCVVCAEKNHPSCKDVVMCDGCLHWYHKVCVGLKKIPSSSWFCLECSTDT